MVLAYLTLTMTLEQTRKDLEGMGPNERRQAIIRVLLRRRRETMGNLASEFGVSIRTIRNDIDILSFSYPITTIRGRYGGGVSIIDGYDRQDMQYLNEKQRKVLEKLVDILPLEDWIVIQSILFQFARRP